MRQADADKEEIMFVGVYMRDGVAVAAMRTGQPEVDWTPVQEAIYQVFNPDTWEEGVGETFEAAIADAFAAMDFRARRIADQLTGHGVPATTHSTNVEV